MAKARGCFPEPGVRPEQTSRATGMRVSECVAARALLSPPWVEIQWEQAGQERLGRGEKVEWTP